MGRAFPEIQMVTPTMYGVSATPMALADEKGNAAIIETIDNRWTERFARSLTVDMGCTAMIALYGMDGRTLKEAMVPATIGLAEELGRLVRETRAAHGDPIGAVLERLNGFRVLTGKIADVARRTETGFARGEAQIEGGGQDAGSTLELRFQNEHLVALRDGEIVVSVPDLIIVLDAETGEPITTEELRYGFRVTVIATPCDRRWRTPAGIGASPARATSGTTSTTCPSRSALARELDHQDLRDLARGAAFLGTGGGGDPYIGRLMVERALADGEGHARSARGGPRRVVRDPDGHDGCADGDDREDPARRRGGRVAARSSRTSAARRTRRCRSRRRNQLDDAARGRRPTGLPVVDADGMGRAFPSSRWRRSPCTASRGRRWRSRTSTATRRSSPRTTTR